MTERQLEKNEISEDVWLEKYKPIPNTVPGGTMGKCGMSIDDVGYMFETYGPDLEFVKETAARDSRYVWTLCEEDGIGFVSTGYHYVNRLGYFITKVPYEGKKYLDVLFWDDAEDGIPKFCESCED